MPADLLPNTDDTIWKANRILTDLLIAMSLSLSAESILRTAAIILTSCALSACSGSFDFFLSPAEKINEAFAPSAEIRVAEEKLRTLLQDDPNRLRVFDEQYAAGLEIRGLTCSQGISIKRFDSIEQVRNKPISRECLGTQDDQLLQYLGILLVGARLSEAPLRPLVPLDKPRTFSVDDIEIISIDAAANAGVGIVRGQRSEFYSVEIPQAAKIAPLGTFPEAYGARPLLAPNGRVAALSIGNRTVAFLDTETGAKLWEAKGLSRLLAWIPNLSAALVIDSKEGKLSIVDFKTGKIAPHGSNLRHLTWAIPLADVQVAVGSARQIALLDHTRNADLLKGISAREFTLKENMITSGPPLLMRGGKTLLAKNNRDLFEIDLETETESVWRVGDFIAPQLAKLSETTLLIDTYSPTGSGPTKPYVWDIEHATIAPVESEDSTSQLMRDLGPRSGFARGRGGRLSIGRTVSTGTPTALEPVLSAFNLERQLARLEAQTRAMENASSFAPAPATPPAAPSVSRAEPPIPAMLGTTAKDARVEAVGVYQGDRGSGRTQTGGHPTGTVEVRLRRSPTPIVLVLSAYEPVRWTLISEPGTTIAAILVSGYYPGQVIGAGSTRVINIGNAHAYKMGTPEYERLNREIMRWTGKSIGIFQGRYEGGTFSVGG